jgi:hypothetical protein
VGGPNETRQTICLYIDCGHQIESEQREVGEVISCEFLACQVRMQTAQSAETIGADSGALQIRQDYPAGVADHDVFYVAASIDEDSDLAIHLA